MINRRLIVVDDEKGILDTYKDIFSPHVYSVSVVSSRSLTLPKTPPKRQSFEVTYVNNGVDALKKIESELKAGTPFAGGFFDVKLGGKIDGLEVIRQIKVLDSNMLCIVVTAYQDRTVDMISGIFGEDYADRWDFISKPFTEAEILQKANHMVSEWDRVHREKEYIKKIHEYQEHLRQSEQLASLGILAQHIGLEFGKTLLKIIAKWDLGLKQGQSKDIDELIKIMVDTTQHSKVIAENLKSLTKMGMKHEKISLLVPLEESLDLLIGELEHRRIKLIRKLGENLPLVNINKIEVGQVFLHLLINAIHSMEHTGGELKINTISQGGGVAVELVDTGCGIPKENFDKIFDPLFTTKEGRGNGIGLSVCKRIVENHGGKITVMSELKKGSVFTVWFPVAIAKAA